MRTTKSDRGEGGRASEATSYCTKNTVAEL